MARRGAHRPILLVTLLMASVFVGCIGNDEPIEQQAATPQLPTLISLTADNVMTFDVPVDVVLVGFPADVAPALAAQLTDEEQAYATLDAPRNFPDNLGAGFRVDAMPVVPTATFRVHQAPGTLGEALIAEARAAAIDDPITSGLDILDANAVEDAFARLAPEHGVTLDPNLNSLVLLHLGDEGQHAYRYTGQTGFREPVRVFGERVGPLIVDVSAASDPWVISGKGGNGDDYDEPLPADTSSVDALTELVEEATRFRLLQAAIYPPTTKPCHAVTLVLAVRSTAVTDDLLGLAPPDGITRLAELKGAFENLTQEDNVFVDLVVVELPQDDPVLEVVARDATPLRIDTIRFWLERNWDAYWVEHAGCEPYVSFLLYGDLVDTSGGGIALYDVERDRRISLSAVNEMTRVRHEYHGEGEEIVNTMEPGQSSGEWAMRLFSHETGHLMAQRHPHDITMTDDGDYNPSFSSVWSSMSYQQRYRVFDFGTVDQINYARNRAGFLVQEALALGLDADPRFTQALDHLGLYHWHTANTMLTELVNE